MSRLYVDGRRTQGTRTGVGHYAHSIISNWPQRDELEVFLAKNKLSAPAAHMLARSFPSGLGWHIRVWLHVLMRRGLYFSPESLLVPILIGRRAMLTIHDLTPLDKPAVHTRWNVWVHRYAMRLAVSRVGKIIVPTSAVKADVVRHFPAAEKRTVVVYEGVRAVDFPDSSNDGFEPEVAPYALYIGTIEPRKNVLELAKTFLESGPEEWRLVLVGKLGWLSDAEKSEFNSLCDHPRISYLGFVPDSWIPKLLADAAVFCYVSEAEGFGLPVAEAMAAGVPVIYTDDPALVEVGDGAGFIVRRNSLREDLAVQLRTVANLTTTSRHAAVVRGRAAGARFDWSKAANTTRSLMLDLDHAQG